uniref:WW domain-containing protein n=1 Tax=Denticeps clupeoides TaxID=299321 RepID=A0AAY4E5G8_9TELE
RPYCGVITKPLTFADCVGDELPLGWEVVYDQQVGVYYIDHINKSTQIENPRTQWRQQQECMLKEYLVVAQEALNTKKETYLVKQQRLELVQQEMQLFHRLTQEDTRSLVSSLSGSSSNAKYDPDQIKEEIACRRERLSRLKQELLQMKQELQYKEMGVETLQEIDRKMSSSHTNYKLDEAQAIFSELRSIKKAISTGEKERLDLIQSLAKLTMNFQSSLSPGDSAAPPGDPSGLQQFCDTGCQTDLVGECGSQDLSPLVDRVRLNWQYEEAKKKVSGIQHQLAQLDGESWTGRAEADRDRDFLQLLREKEALLQEITLLGQQQRPPEAFLQLEEERHRLEEEVQRAQSSQGQGASQRVLQQEKRNVLLRQLEEATRITTYLHSQLKSLSASTLTVSSSSSRGSLASSRGSLASSRGSLSSISFSDIYGLPQYERAEPALDDPHLRYLLPVEVSARDAPACGSDLLGKTKRSHDTPQSLASLSSRSSLSSLSPPSSPMDTPYHSAPQDCPLAQMTEEYMEVAGRAILRGHTQSQPPSQAASGPVDCESGGGPASLTDHILPLLPPCCVFVIILGSSLSCVRVHVLPVDSSRPCPYYCSRAHEPRSPLDLNEGFHVPLPAGGPSAHRLHLSVLSLGPQGQEELLVSEGGRSNGPFHEPMRVRPKERAGRWSHASPFMRSSTIVRSQTFTPGARSQYVCRLYRSDSDSSTLPKKSPFIRNTLERRTLRYKQSYRSSLAEQPTRTSLDLELDLQACRTRQRQLSEELATLRELKLRLEEPAAGEAGELQAWALRDERFRGLLHEAQRQSRQEQRQEEAADRRLRKASKEVRQMRGQGQTEPLPVQTFREKMAFFTRPRFHIPPLPADDV